MLQDQESKESKIITFYLLATEIAMCKHLLSSYVQPEGTGEKQSCTLSVIVTIIVKIKQS